MAIVYNGQGSLVSPTVGVGTRVQIFSSTSTSPVVVSTVTAHGFNTGDTVEIEGHTINTPADRVSQITVIDSKHFSLNGTTGFVAGGSTGYAIDYELQPAIVLPAGGDLVDPGTVQAFAEGLANTAPYLYRASGKFRLYDVYSNGNSSYAQVGSQSGLANTGPALLTGCGSLFGFGAPAPVVKTGDVLDITIMGGIAAISATATNVVTIEPGISIAGFGGGAYKSPQQIGFTGNSPGGQIPVYAVTSPGVFLGFYVNATISIPTLGGPDAAFDIGLMTEQFTASPTTTVGFNGPWSVIVHHYHPN